MNITSAKFIKGVVQEDEILDDGKTQVAFIGRSNVGKSSVINVLTGKKDLARTSSFPGRTKEVNVFLISARGENDFYLLDLPGYGFAKGSKEEQGKIQQLIYWYFFQAHYEQKLIVLIIDAEIGLTKTDIEMVNSLDQAGKNIVIVANKIDKVKKSALHTQLQKIKNSVGQFKVIPFSAEKKTGITELLQEINK
jgi:GTP-binding protein